MRKLTLGLLLVFLVMVILGCSTSNFEPPPIIGVVCSNPGINQSYYIGGINVAGDSVPLEGATIQMFFDEKCTQIVKGYAAQSDAQGNYKLEVKDIPKSPAPYGEYFILVEKEGFQPVTMQVGLGPRSNYFKNTVLLKPEKSASKNGDR